jgi:hypothetical protein
VLAFTPPPGRFSEHAGVAQLVEHQLPKLRVAGSSPVARFIREKTRQGLGALPGFSEARLPTRLQKN